MLPLGTSKPSLNTPGIKIKFCIFFIFRDFFIYRQCFDDKSSFPCSCASITLIIQCATSKSAYGLISHSGHWGPASGQVYLKDWCFGHYLYSKKHKGPPQAALVCPYLLLLCNIKIIKSVYFPESNFTFNVCDWYKFKQSIGWLFNFE